MHRAEPSLVAKLAAAQRERFHVAFPSAYEYLKRGLDDVKLTVKLQARLKEQPASVLADVPARELAPLCAKLLVPLRLPAHVADQHSRTLSERLHLIRAFAAPDSVITQVTTKITEIVGGFPRSAQDLERGRNPGDVLDPYILSATQELLFGGQFPPAIAATVSHKALMMVEGLLGHLHEDVIGQFRGNVRAPEPRGFNQEEIDLAENPAPGADIIQPPSVSGDSLKFHQVKSKTGSAKGGDGKRLGEQLRRLQRYYKADIFYDALIGNTLRGHRSRRGVEAAAPGVVVLVGQAAFRALTDSTIGPELLLRLYQTAFVQASRVTGYRLDTMVVDILDAFEIRAKEHGGDFLQVVLDDSIRGEPAQQDSRHEGGTRGTT